MDNQQISVNNSTPLRYSKKARESGIIQGQILGGIRGVVYFDQLSGACSTRKLVETC